MIKKIYSSKKFYKKKHMKSATAILKGTHGVVRLNYDLTTVSKLGPQLITLYLGLAELIKDDHLKVCRGLHKMRKFYYKGSISRGSSIKRFVERVAKQRATNPNGCLSWVSFVREYQYANHLPVTIVILGIQKGNMFSKRRWARQKEGSSPELYLKENHAKSNAIPTFRRDGNGVWKKENFGTKNGSKREAPLSSRCVSLLTESNLGWPLLRRSDPMSEEALGKSEAKNMSVVQWVMSLPDRFNSENHVDFGSKEETESHEIGGDSPQLIQFSGDKLLLGDDSRNHRNENSVSLSQNELPLSRHGWPLLQIAVESQDSLKESEAMKMSMFQLKKPAHSISESPRLQSDHPVSVETRNPTGNMNNENCLITPRHLVSELELLDRTNLSGCRRFSYAELKLATNQFSSDNLIGEGGCSNVYRGFLPSGKSVAVKVLKPYKQAWTDFSLEVDIISSIKHEHITPLIGVCVDHIHLISVYDFFPKGSLEENLHAGSGKSTLPWAVRFKVAVVVAEALDYLHNGCPRPVIHRDIKSSNILLTNELQPQLSDFGLAIWGSTDSPYAVHDDVVGTFGYMAPEYFMNGRVSDKIDVYAFGVVLLELLSGRKPIGGEVPKGQESLVKWAKHLLEKGDAKALLDPELNGDLDDAQVQRMVLAARFCISQSARVRPKMSQILKLLRGKETAQMFVNSLVMDSKDLDYQDDDDLIFEFGRNKQSGFALPDTDSAVISTTCDGKSSSSAKKVHRLKLKDYLKEQQDKSSSSM